MTALPLVLLVLSGAPADSLEAGALVGIPPHVGVVLSESEKPGVVLFFPWALKLLPEEGGVLRPSQLVIEPGVVFRAVTSFTARAALRWLRPAFSWLTLGGGMGMGLEASPEGAGLSAVTVIRAVSSIDLVARLGKGPVGFAALTTRVELRMDGTTAWLIAAGGTYW